MTKLRITSDGTAWGTKVYAGDVDVTSRVVAVELGRIEHNTFVTAKVEFTEVELEIEAEREHEPEASSEFKKFGLHYQRIGEIAQCSIFGYRVFERVGHRWRFCFYRPTKTQQDAQ
jgi:hypothetical protein